MESTENSQMPGLIKKIYLGIDSAVNARLSGIGMTAAQLEILAFLLSHREEAPHSTDLCQALGVSRSTVSALLKKMRDKGYLVFCSNLSDDRQKDILLTERARVLDGEMDCCAEYLMRHLYRGFTTDELGILTELLKKMYGNIKIMIKEEAVK